MSTVILPPGLGNNGLEDRTMPTSIFGCCLTLTNNPEGLSDVG